MRGDPVPWNRPEYNPTKPHNPLLAVNNYNRFNPLSPPDALKHHFTSLKTHLISYN